MSYRRTAYKGTAPVPELHAVIATRVNGHLPMHWIVDGLHYANGVAYLRSGSDFAIVRFEDIDPQK